MEQDSEFWLDEAPDHEEVDTEQEQVEPEPMKVDFVVLRDFSWHGQDFEAGTHELDEDEYGALMFDLNQRTDRVNYVAQD